VIFGCITHLPTGRYLRVLLAESFEKQIGECLQQLLWRRLQRRRSSASAEIEDELIARVTSHLNPPQS
jgi:hypothetical protein